MKVNNKHSIKLFTFLILICLFVVPSFGSKDKDNDDWKCGKKYGKCKKDYCCSKYGWCGKSDIYCDISKGCQSKYGKCNSETPIENNEDDEDNDEDNEIAISTDGRCGENRGKCMKGYCCSKYGWCGKSDKYCKISKGCKPEYGKCNDKSTSNKDEKENKEKEDNGDDENWKKDFEEVDILIIDVIAEELNMTSSTVSKVYDYTDKRDKGYKKVLDNYLKNKLSEELCLNECKKVNTELKDTFKDDNDNITTLNEYSKNIFGESVFSECDV